MQRAARRVVRRQVLGGDALGLLPLHVGIGGLRGQLLHPLSGGVLGDGGLRGLLGERVRRLLGLAAGLVGLLGQRCLLARALGRRAHLQVGRRGRLGVGLSLLDRLFAGRLGLSRRKLGDGVGVVRCARRIRRLDGPPLGLGPGPPSLLGGLRLPLCLCGLLGGGRRLRPRGLGLELGGRGLALRGLVGRLLGLQRPLGPLGLFPGRGLGVHPGGMRLLGRLRGLQAGLFGKPARLMGVLGGLEVLDGGQLCGSSLGGGDAGRLGRRCLCLLSLLGDPGPGLGHPLGVGLAGVGREGLLRLGCGSLVSGLLRLERRAVARTADSSPAASASRRAAAACSAAAVAPATASLGSSAGLVGLRGQPRLVGRRELGHGPLVGKCGGDVLGHRAGLVSRTGEPRLLRGRPLGVLASRVGLLDPRLGRHRGLGRGLLRSDRLDWQPARPPHGRSWAACAERALSTAAASASPRSA